MDVTHLSFSLRHLTLQNIEYSERYRQMNLGQPVGPGAARVEPTGTTPLTQYRASALRSQDF